MDLSFLMFGEEGKTVIFLHGWQQNKNSFSPLVPHLFKNFRLILLDLPGFGKSPLPPNSFNSYDYANLIVDWIEKQGLSKIVLVGHSFGGKIAAIISSKNPPLVSKLILISSSGITHQKIWYKFSKYIPKTIRNAVRPVLISRDYKEAEGLLPIFKNIVKENLQLVFTNITIPTLIIWGKNDTEIPLSDGKKIHKMIEKSKFIVLETDHFPFLRMPEKVSKIITKFIKNG